MDSGHDAGSEGDAGADAGRLDAGLDDAGANDGGAVDSGALDAGEIDGGRSDSGSPDAGGLDGGSVQLEQEPNNAATATQVNAFATPGAMTGAIDPANDLEVLTVSLAAGEVWRWTLEPASASSVLAPHLAIAENANQVPSLVGRGGQGATVTQEQFALSNGRYNLIVRDARNVGTSQNVGGPMHQWRLRAERSSRVPAAITLPTVASHTLTSATAQGLFSFTLSTMSTVTIEVRCQGKAPASDMDPRLSLFDANQKRWVQTNDDRALSNVDPLLEGPLPAGSYVLVVDNVKAAPADLSYELRVSSN